MVMATLLVITLIVFGVAILFGISYLLHWVSQYVSFPVGLCIIVLSFIVAHFLITFLISTAQIVWDFHYPFLEWNTTTLPK